MIPSEPNKGNPDWKPGVAQNPQGRPRGLNHLKVRERLLGKHKTHPVDKLVQLANLVAVTDPELAAEIWLKLLSYMEPAKKPVETAPEKPGTPEDSKAAAEAAHHLLQELENDSNREGSSGTPSVANRKPEIQAEAGSEEDL